MIGFLLISIPIGKEPEGTVLSIDCGFIPDGVVLEPED
jgi:hypothetical protein